MSRTRAAGKVKRKKRYACNHRDCDRLFALDGISAHRGVPKKGVCPDHPDARVRKVWIEERVRPGKVDWPAVKERLHEQGIVLIGGGPTRPRRSTSASRKCWPPTATRSA